MRHAKAVRCLVVLASLAALVACGGGGGRKAPAAEPRAAALHPFSAGIGHLLTDVAYEIATSSSWPTAFVRTLIENAPAKVADMNAPFVHPDNDVLRYEVFHVWPNLFNLTVIRDEDPGLYTLILDQVLARETDASVRTQIDAGTGAGNRVFLARDFLPTVNHAGLVFHEVHYVLVIDLDAKTVTEVHAHALPLDQLPRLHDPHVDQLVALFAAGAPAVGSTWDLCLRGDVNRLHYEAFVVDRLQDGRWHLARLAACGTAAPHVVFVRGLLPWIPDKPPEEPLPPPTKDDPPPTIIPDPDPPLFPGGTFTPPPVRPWPFPAPQPPDLPPDPTDGSTGTPPEPTSGCDLEGPAIEALKTSLEASWQQGLDDWNADRETLRGFRWAWVEGVTFHDPDVQAAYDACNGPAQALQQDIDDLEQQMSDAYDAWEAVEAAKPLVVSTIPWANALWDQLVTLGGFWSRVRASCLITVVFPDNTVIPVTPEEQTDFQRWIATALSDGATWDQAVAEAQAHEAARRTAEGFTPGEIAVFAQAWAQYADCLKGLQRDALELFIPALEGFENATQDEIDRIIDYLFDRDDSILTPTEVQARADCEAAAAQLEAELEALRAMRAAKEAQLEDKRLEFAGDVRDGPMHDRVGELNRMRQRLWILCSYLIWCSDPSHPEAFPIAGPWFCTELQALQTDPAFASFPAFQDYVQMLLDVNC
ncbi:MAG: hypothetical protein AB7T63_03690 [Planctomycetota bacterium]